MEDLLEELEGFRLQEDLFDPAPRGRRETLEVGDLQVPRIVNEFWTAKQRQGHSLHELSCRACFKAELPAFFIRRFTEPGDRVLDPFAGRGTTLLEAALQGRVPIGNDVNPLSGILLRPRLDPPSLDEVRTRLAEIELEDPGAEAGEPDLAPFYAPGTLGALRALRARFLRGEREGGLDRVDAWLRMVATNRLTGHSSGFFSGRTMPPNQAVTPGAQRKLNEKLGLEPPERDARALLLRKSRSLLRGLTETELRVLADVRDGARMLHGDARKLEGLGDEAVALTVTSPPFLDVVDYATDNWLRCWFNGLDAEAIGSGITCSRKLEDWCEVMDGVFAELHRVTRPGGHVAFEVGEVRGGSLRLEEPLLEIVRDRGFEILCVLVHDQEFTKTANCWGVANNAKGTNTNRILLCRKPAGAS